MKKILSISLICLSFVSYSQTNHEELVVVEKPKPVKVVTKTISVAVVPSTLKQALLTGFKTGNAPVISAYFSQNVDISLLGKDNLYSKSQAEQVLKTFFSEHKPSNFVINHEGQSSNAKYYIGTLSTFKGTFRITINTKSNLIARLTIEK
jgi:hypothetical protein